MGYKALNNAYSTLASSINAVAMTLQVATGHGDRFPVIAGSDFTYITLEDASSNIEIVKVTARATSSDTFTIERAQDGTTARSWAAGDIVELRVVAALLDIAIAHVDDTSAAHAASAISFTNAGTSLAATNEQDAIVELDTDRQVNSALIAANAANITTNTGNIAANTAAIGAFPTDTASLTNKTINLASNTLTGTIAQFNAALSDGDFATTAAVDLKLAIADKASTAEAETGTDDAKYMTALKTKEAITAQLPFTKEFLSSAISISSGNLASVAHGFGVKPKLMALYLKCTSADLNYSVDDEVELVGVLGMGTGSATLSQGVSIITDATDIDVKFASATGVFQLPNKSTGNQTSITNSRWELYIRAWA